MVALKYIDWEHDSLGGREFSALKIYLRKQDMSDTPNSILMGGDEIIDSHLFIGDHPASPFLGLYFLFYQ